MNWFNTLKTLKGYLVSNIVYGNKNTVADVRGEDLTIPDKRRRIMQVNDEDVNPAQDTRDGIKAYIEIYTEYNVISFDYKRIGLGGYPFGPR